MIILQTYWGPLLFAANLLCWLCAGGLWSLRYRTWKPLLLMGALVLLVGFLMLALALHSYGRTRV
jgi:hypothetical protein